MSSSQSYAMKEVSNMKSAEPKPKSSCMSSRAKCVLVSILIVVFICAVVILAIALVNKTQKYDELLEKYGKEQASAAEQTKISDICLTYACLETANRVNQYMDVDASPCDNFYQYACGGWEKMNSIPYFSAYSWSVIEELDHNNAEFFRDQLELPVSTTSYEPDRKARRLYKTCMDTDGIAELGLSEPRAIIDSMGGMSFNVSEPYPDFDLTERLVEMRELHSNGLFVLSINFHRYQANTILLDLSPPTATLLLSQKESPSVFQLLGIETLNVWNDLYEGETPPDTDTFLETYYIMNDIKDAIDSPLVAANVDFNDTLLTIEDIQLLCPQINWTRVISATLDKINKPIPELISVPKKNYFLTLSVLINLQWKRRSLDNYLKFSFVLENINYFDYKYRKVQENLLNNILVQREFWRPNPRWLFCVNELSKHLEMVLGRWYVEEYLEKDEAVVKDVDEMIEEIRSMYIEVLQQTQLLDSETRNFAIRKIKAMEKQVAYSQDYKNLTFVDLYHKHVVAQSNSSYFMNMVNTARGDQYYELSLIGVLSQEDWDDLWIDYPFVVNGFYSSTFNKFTILAGILQGTFYELGNPKYMNYGSMGFTIGHEFTHGFDDTGRHYGVNGLVKSWWTDASEQNFRKAKQCYEKQYSVLEVTAYGSNDSYIVDSNSTSDENIADNGAEYVVFQAYEDWVKKNGKEQLLPIKPLDTWQKQYYIAQAQGWCAKYTSAGFSSMSSTFVHSQKEARVNGMVQNSVRFADIFECPIGSAMNPEKKCKLW